MELNTTATEQAAVGKTPVSRIREDFPALQRTITKKENPLAYLDNAATTQKPRQVIDAVNRYYEKHNANVHRALHTLGEEATARFEESRAVVREFIGAKSSREIVFTHGTTESINLVASSWGRKNLNEGDEILLSEMEHHSNLIPWQLLAAEKSLTLRFIPVEDDGSFDLERLENNWSERIRFVSVTHASNVLGTINDIKTIVEIAHNHGAPVLIDSAQGVPHLPVDVRKIGCDFLAFSGHKLYGPMGIGVLYGREDLLEQMPPMFGGGEMIRAVWLDHATWNDLPYKFEAGTPNVGGAIGLASAIRYVNRLGMKNIRYYEDDLTRYALRRLDAIPEITIHGRAKTRGSVLSFSLGDLHPHDIAQFLDSEGIAVRAGHHCAQPLHRKLGIPASVRASLCFYNTREEIDHLTETLKKTVNFFTYGIR